MFPAKDIMTKDVLSIKQTDSIYKAIEMLADFRVSGLPVTDDNNCLVGMISEWDVLHLLTDEEMGVDDPIETFMTKEVVSFNEEDSAVDICDFLKNHNKRRVPIVRDGKLVGIVSRHDIIKLILKLRKRHVEE